MKKYLLAALVALVGGAGTPAPAQQPLTVERIHEVPGKSKADICRAARDWAAVTFKDSKAVVEVFDLEAGRMIGKGRALVSGPMGSQTWVDFTLQVDCKDGRARATYDRFMLNYQGSAFPLRDGIVPGLVASTENRILALDLGLVEGLKSGKSDNW